MEKAERLGRRRARLLLAVGLMLVTLQGVFLSVWREPVGPLRAVDLVYIAGWSALVIAALVAILTGAGYGYGPEVRALVNDESARANRDDALRYGFASTITSGLILFVASFMEPFGAREACHVIVSLGLGTALLRYGKLEKRAHELD
ncbi:MAG: hypothetical protein B7Z08_01705 [Sphingomonadales bacterium 32-68-7]|nr:MAG: hypothetical protein B7Z33_07895 [Sphingomonadales bacterium 12-68-11]OYX10210.1 MAG: hypothetical protein B7Z08_01705 [Sphingomonadales bacterium 32-68-7]